MSRQEQRAQSADILIQTALKLFSEKGYDKTSIRSIATEAGVSLGLMYNYFSGKEELLLEIFRRGNEDVMASLSAPGAPSPESGEY